MDKLPVRHGAGPARRALDVDGPTHRSFAKLESNGRPFRTVEILVATVATGSLSAGGKRWRRTARRLVVRGRPPGRAAGRTAAIQAHAALVRSVS